MDGQLYDYLLALEKTVTTPARLAKTNIQHKYNPITGKDTIFVVSPDEPVDIVLPLNVFWLVTDDTSQHYRQLLQRESKEQSTDYAYTWSVVTEMATVSGVTQVYDDEDLGKVGNSLQHATTARYGLASITEDADNPVDPLFVSATDPRNSDPRYPNDHTHPEKPAVQLYHSDKAGTVTINKGSTTQSSVEFLKAESAESASQLGLSESDLITVDLDTPNNVSFITTNVPRFMDAGDSTDIIVYAQGSNMPKVGEFDPSDLISLDPNILSTSGKTLTAVAPGQCGVRVTLTGQDGSSETKELLVIVE